MAYLINQIGEHDFISLEGEVDPPGQMIAIDSRPGVRGMEFTQLGFKGRPFVLVSFRDYTDLGFCELFLRNYKKLIEADPVQVWKNGVPILGNDYFCKVLSVTPLNKQIINTAVGNKLSAGSGAIMSCQFELIAVPR